MEVWHVRHGQRVDEVSGPVRSAWAGSTAVQEGRYYDSPLTKHGHIQASMAGIYLSRLPFNQEGTTADGKGCSPSFDRVYTSPLIRAVQTAACVSQALGGLPLQIVPGLCACTAGLVRTGYENTVLMTDADIADAFPEVQLIPRDPSAPTSFHGAQEWLATRPYRRVLAVGHREGTKAMAGRSVPTPHCCIGIFEVDEAKSYKLHDLLSHKGKSLGPQPSRYARQTKIQKDIQLEGPEDTQNSPENCGSKAQVTRSASDTATDKGPPPQARGIGQVQRPTTVGEYGTVSVSPEFVHGIWKGGQRWSGRKLIGRVPSSARRKRSNAKPKPASGVKAKSSILTVQRLCRRSRSASVDGNKTKGSTASSAKAASGTQSDQDTPGVIGGNGGAAPPPYIERCISHDAAHAPASRGRAKSHTASKGKPAARACAGRGFRVAALARRSMIESSRYAGVMGVPLDTLTGPSGVLCFLRPTELCTVRRMLKFIYMLYSRGRT